MRKIMYLTFWAALIFFFGYLAVAQASQYSAMRHEITQIEAEIDRAVIAYEALQRQLQFIGSDAYIEEQARQRLGLVRSNEIAFRVLGR